MEFQDSLIAAIKGLMCDRFGVLPDHEGISDVELAAAERALRAPLPQSYRIFLRYFGAHPNAPRCLFGLPRHRTWGDIVLMNFLDNSVSTGRYVKFAEEGGRGFYFDTAQMDDRGECPVVLRTDGGTIVFADDFAAFLDQCGVEAAG